MKEVSGVVDLEPMYDVYYVTSSMVSRSRKNSAVVKYEDVEIDSEADSLNLEEAYSDKEPESKVKSSKKNIPFSEQVHKLRFHCRKSEKDFELNLAAALLKFNQKEKLNYSDDILNELIQSFLVEKVISKEQNSNGKDVKSKGTNEHVVLINTNLLDTYAKDKGSAPHSYVNRAFINYLSEHNRKVRKELTTLSSTISIDDESSVWEDDYSEDTSFDFWVTKITKSETDKKVKDTDDADTDDKENSDKIRYVEAQGKEKARNNAPVVSPQELELIRLSDVNQSNKRIKDRVSQEQAFRQWLYEQVHLSYENDVVSFYTLAAFLKQKQYMRKSKNKIVIDQKEKYYTPFITQWFYHDSDNGLYNIDIIHWWESLLVLLKKTIDPLIEKLNEKYPEADVENYDGTYYSTRSSAIARIPYKVKEEMKAIGRLDSVCNGGKSLNSLNEESAIRANKKNASPHEQLSNRKLLVMNTMAMIHSEHWEKLDLDGNQNTNIRMKEIVEDLIEEVKCSAELLLSASLY